ncbi:MAG: site-specific integrase [Clostridiaceae bacterium]
MAVKTNVTINGIKYYQLYENVGINPDGSIKYKRFYGKNKSDAENKRDLYFAKKHITKSYSMASECLKWLDNVVKVSGIKGSSYERYRGIYDNYIKTAPFAFKRVLEVKGTDIQSYYAELAKSGKSYSQIQNLHKLLKRFFDYCYLNDMVLKNPSLNVTIPNQVKQKYYKEKVEIDVFTTTEKESIIDKSIKENLMYGAAIYFMFNFGMRIGEVLGLTIRDIGKDEITIRNTLSRYKDFDLDKYVKKLDDPKTETSIRTLYYSKETAFLIKKLKAERLRLIEILGDDYKNIYNLLITTPYGTPIDVANIRKFWKKILNELKIPYRKIHTARHTFITDLSENEIPLDLVQKMVGHRRGSKITEDVYTHAKKDSFKKAMLKITK